MSYTDDFEHIEVSVRKFHLFLEKTLISKNVENKIDPKMTDFGHDPRSMSHESPKNTP